MKRLMVGDCDIDRMFAMEDPDASAESDFEAVVVKALSCFFLSHICVVFGGAFLHDGQISRPDLALVARDFSHWFVIEVELASHSLERHVLPQVRALRYGTPQNDCATILARELEMSLGAAGTLVATVPRGTAVVVNRRDDRWEQSLSAIPAQYLSMTSFQTAGGQTAIEMEGFLEADRRHIGFGTYSATDQSFRFPAAAEIPEGDISVRDHFGVVGVWTCRTEGLTRWLTKSAGVPSIDDETIMQLVRLASGTFAFRLPPRSSTG